MNKNAAIIFGVGVVILAVVVVVLAKQQANERADQSKTQSTQTTQPNSTEPSAGNAEVTKEDLVVGEGAEATVGKKVAVHYTGTFTNGEKFDSSLDHGQPFSFTIGAGEVIKGWEQGVVGMKVGGKRKLTVPPELGYGPNDYGDIPGGSVLVFEIELLEVN